MPTTIGVADPRAVKRFGMSLANQVDGEAFFDKFEGTSTQSIVQRKTELEEEAGDEVTFDLVMDLRSRGVTGDNRAEGLEEDMVFHTDRVRIDQFRKPVSGGGQMSRKRTLHNIRTVARDRLASYIAKWLDQGKFAYASGDVGLTAVNPDRVFTEVDFAGNPIQAPDATHQMFAGAATSRLTLTAGDTMSNVLIERAAVKASMLQAVNPDAVRLMPVNTGNAGGNLILLISPWQGYNLRTATGDNSWLRMTQAIATAEGRNNPMVRGGIGMVAGVVVHENDKVLRWNNGGAGQNLPWARALLLGRQALVVAYGAPAGGTRMQWKEKLTDYENMVGISCGMIMGIKKTRYNGLDAGVVAVDTIATDPNP